MRNSASQLHHIEKTYPIFNFKKAKKHIHQHWFRIMILVVLAFIFTRKDFTFELNLNSQESIAKNLALFSNSETAANTPQNNPQTAAALLPLLHEEKNEPVKKEVQKLHTEDTDIPSVTSTPKPAPVKKETRAELISLFDDNTSNTYSNMTYSKKGQTVKAEKPKTSRVNKQEFYVKRFAGVAQSEMKKYGIPASITLAQGLIESNAGESRLSVNNNNHFGMKCFSKKCGKGHCSNFTDDSHKDFFRKYKSAWESYRSHSKMLMGKRYKGLRKHGKDYKAWAHGLKKAGYATDKKYAEKLIHIIEELNLQRFDK